MSQDEIFNKHRKNIRDYEVLNKFFNFLNILLTPKDISMCSERINKRTDVYKEQEIELDSEERLGKVAKSLEVFDNNTIAINLKFHNIRVDRQDTMLDIHKDIKDIIKDSDYILETKKPT